MVVEPPKPSHRQTRSLQEVLAVKTPPPAFRLSLADPGAIVGGVGRLSATGRLADACCRTGAYSSALSPEGVA